MRVLCVYNEDSVEDLFKISPEEALEGHEVTSVHTYQQMIEVLKTRTPGYFQMVLCDIAVPLGMKDGKWLIDPMPPLLQMELFERRKIKGLGIFVPKNQSEHFMDVSGPYTIAASRDCWTVTDDRDWQKLLDTVLTPA